MENAFTGKDLEAFWRPQPISQTPDLCYQISAEAEELQKLKKSSSEWAFDRFIQETGTCSPLSSSSVIGDRLLEDLSIALPDTSKVKSGTLHEGDAMNKSSIRCQPSFICTADSDYYNSYTRTQLNRDCAETASLISTKNPFPSPPSTEKDSETSKHFKSDILTSGGGFSIVQPMADGRSTGIAAVPSLHKKLTTHGQTTSESSRDPSDDEDVDGDTETTENNNPSDDKRARRMQSNRESARRSRRRKQDHLNDLEKQVEQLKFENSNLSKRLSHVNQKYKDASVDNRVLRANIETLRTKVKMAEDTVKRATGTYNPLLQPMSASGEGLLSDLSDPCMAKLVSQPVNLIPSHGQPVSLHPASPTGRLGSILEGKGE